MTVLAFPQSRPSVLVLNDCPDTLALLTKALQSGGFRVRAATLADFREGAGTGLANKSASPDVVVYDIGSGGSEEWARLQALTESPELLGKPLVITTTNVVKVEGQRDAVYMRSRFQFVSTAYDLSDLVGRVSDAIGLTPLANGLSDSRSTHRSEGPPGSAR